MAALMACGACALDAPPAQETLSHATSHATADTRAAQADPVAEVDRLAAAALDQARQEPASAPRAVAAARVLFQAADIRRQRASLAVLAREPDAGLPRVLTVDGDLPAEVRQQVLSLCTSGRELAERALAATPDDVAAQLTLAQHLSLIGWANGPARALFAGLGPRLTAALDRVVASDPAFDHAAPLRLQGRVLAQAPWPYGDRQRAKAILERAVGLAPIAIHHLFLGDVLHDLGETGASQAQWRLALSAPDDEATRAVTPLLRELAERRLAAALRPASR